LVFVIPDLVFVIPDLIRDPVLLEHWIADQVRNDKLGPAMTVGSRDDSGCCNDSGCRYDNALYEAKAGGRNAVRLLA